MGTVEVETAESVNHLEAMAQWAHLGRARAPFHLYVPAGCVDIARRLAAENDVNVAEIWSYHTIGDQTRFTLVHRAPASESRRHRQRRAAAEAGRAPQRGPRLPSRAAAALRARKAAGQGRRAKAAADQARHASPSRAGPRAEKEVALPHLRFNRDKRGYENTLRRPHRRGARTQVARASSIGSGRRPASGSAARRSTRTRSA